MDYYQDFVDRINKLIKNATNSVIPGIVSAVNESVRTCTIKVGNIEYEDVRLYGLVKEDLKGFCFIPSIGSYVLAGKIQGSNELFVLMFTQVDKVLMTIGEKVEFAADKETVSYKNDKVSLKITGSDVELEAEQITINKGSFDGLVKVRELEKNLDSIKAFVEAMHGALPTAFSAVGAALAAAGANGASNYTGTMAGKAIKIGDMENTKVTH